MIILSENIDSDTEIITSNTVHHNLISKKDEKANINNEGQDDLQDNNAEIVKSTISSQAVMEKDSKNKSYGN